LHNPTSKSVWLGHRQYWICQGIFWLAIAGPELTSLLVKGEADGQFVGVVFSLLIQTPIGVLATHLYRALLIRSGWRDQKLSFLWWRVSLVILATASLTSLPTSLYLFSESQAMIRESMEKVPEARALLDVWPVRYREVWASLAATDALIQVAWVIIYLAARIQLSLAASRRRELELQSALKESELTALRSHLNPHFFFNTLNTLRTLIDLNPGQARLAVDHLADLMRLTLRIGPERAVPLRMELTMVQAYLDLEKMRFEERLTIEDNIPPETLDHPVPPFALQVLVENALKHGVGRQLQGGTVRLRAVRQSPTAVTLEVRSPGPMRGPDPDSTGVGLANLRERLRLGFGGGSNLTVAEEGGEVVATLLVENDTPPMDTPA
jgi:two-component system, LytTR family, sensor kinase